MTEQLNPITARDTCEIIADAITSEKTLEIMGAGSRRSIGRPMETDHILSTSALNGFRYMSRMSWYCVPALELL